MELAEAIGKTRVDGVRLRRPLRPAAEGSLAVTGHNLIFSAQEDELILLHRAVDCVSLETRSSGTTLLTARCKDLAVLIFEFKNADDAAAVARSVEVLSNLADIELAYPFHYRPPFETLEDGWKSFTVEEEFARLQIHTDFWRVSNVNRDFAVCGSYPEQVIVPKSVGDDVLAASARFRDGGRFPVLSYYHKDTKAAILRCGQPLLGQGGRRCREDEALLSALAGAAGRGYVLDTRPQQVAQAAKAKGGGYELDQYYPLWKRSHRNLPRWQTLRDAYAKLVEAANDAGCTTEKWLSRVNGSGWLAAVAELLTAACVVAQSVDREEMSVVVHGGEGMDNTLSVCSLARVLLDPDARTIRGLSGLVEQEWVGGGHPFRSRCAHAAYAAGKETGAVEAPSFLLFLHTLAALAQQYASSFEYRHDFLLLLADHAYASEFGTFLGDHEKEKSQHQVKENTVSLWSFVNRPENLSKYLNPFYEPNQYPLWPSVAPQSLPLWERALFRWTQNWTAQEAAETAMAKAKLEQRALMGHVTRLRRQLVDLERQSLQSSTLTLNSH